jgi:anti-sigma factor RsiW
MNCKDAGPLLHAYLDGEMEPRAVSDLEVHLAGCAACAAELASLETLRTEIRRNAPRYAAPPALRARLAAIDRFAPVAEPSRDRVGWAVAAALLLSFALGAAGMYGLGGVLFPQRSTNLVFAGLIASHLRALAAASPVDVISSDRHTVKPWFAGRVDQSPPVIDLADDGFPLVGGRIDYIGERRLPVIVYRHAQHLIDVYWFVDAPPDPDMPSMERRGFHLIAGSRDAQRAWVVSDLDPNELARFTRLLGTATPAR